MITNEPVDPRDPVARNGIATDFTPIIEEMDRLGFGINKIAMRLGLQFVQVQRIKVHGRAEHGLGEALLKLHREVCLHSVPQSTAPEMRMA